jgi:acyl dehydratase
MIEWFDDLTLGMRFKSGEVSVSKEDIKRFAAEFDPQPFHLAEGAAQKTVFKGLAASGWHTAAISMGLTVEVRPFGPHPLMGLGVDELRWMLPVRPGDVLHVEGEVVELIPSRTKPQGIAKIKWTTYNQRGEAVYSSRRLGLSPVVPIRPPDLLISTAVEFGLRSPRGCETLPRLGGANAISGELSSALQC